MADYSPVSVPLSNAVFFLTVPLEYANIVDDGTLARLRAALATNFAQHFAQPRCSTEFALEGSVMPPKPILNAGFAVRMRWTDWFTALSPSGTPILLTVTDDRDAERTPRPTPRLRHAPSPIKTPRAPSPTPSLGRSSSCSSLRSDVPSLVSTSSHSTAPTSSSSCPSPEPEHEPLRRPRRQRGGVKQKQRGIHVDRSRLEVTPYDGGGTGVLTGGVMLGRRVRPALV